MGSRRGFLVATLAALAFPVRSGHAQPLPGVYPPGPYPGRPPTYPPPHGYYRPPMPPPRYEARPPPPPGRYGWHWSTGRWRWNGHRWVWVSGRWRY